MMMRNEFTRNNIILLVCLILIIFFYPALSTHRVLIRDIIFTAIILTGAYSLDFAKKTRTILIVSGAITIGLSWLNYLFVSDLAKIVSFLSFFCFNLFITVFMIRHIASSQKVTPTIILNSINGYLLIGVLGAVLLSMAQLVQLIIFGSDSGAISFSGGTAAGLHDYLYFSFVTLTTLGYGDVTPVSAFAKSLTIIIAVSGQLYLTILVAILVGKYLSNPEKR
jgi:voltage-gated potassium channel